MSKTSQVQLELGTDDFARALRQALDAGTTAQVGVGKPLSAALTALLDDAGQVKAVGPLTATPRLRPLAVLWTIAAAKGASLVFRSSASGELTAIVTPRDVAASRASVDGIEQMLPARHRSLLRDLSDPVHRACEMLVPGSPARLRDLQLVNDWLHDSSRPHPWPAHRIAFASGGCGDYYAYERRDAADQTVVYIEPGASSPSMTFATFDDWYRHLTAPRAH